MEDTSTPTGKVPLQREHVGLQTHCAYITESLPLDAQGLALQPGRGLMQSGEYQRNSRCRDGFPRRCDLHSVNHKQEEASAVSTCFCKAVPE